MEIKKAPVPSKGGFSLIEILIVVLIFAVIGILLSQTIILTLQTTKKADTTTRVRENVDFVLASIDRQLHSALSISSVCDGSKIATLNYTDANGSPGSYSCTNTGNNGYVASGAAQLTSSQIAITDCYFICIKINAAPSVDVGITATDKNVTGKSNATISATTKIYLRTY